MFESHYGNTLAKNIKRRCVQIISWSTDKHNTFSCLGVCMDNELQSGKCSNWKRSGYCTSGSRYYDFMSKNCQKSCGLCGSGKNTFFINLLDFEFKNLKCLILENKYHNPSKNKPCVDRVTLREQSLFQKSS